MTARWLPWPQLLGRGVLLMFTVLGFSALMYWTQTTPVAEGALPVTEATLGDRLVTLPHDWMRDVQMDAQTTASYVYVFDLDAPPQTPWAVYFPRVIMNASVSINGDPLGARGRMTPPVSRGWNRPLMFPLTPRQLRAGENVLRVTLQADGAGKGLMDAFWLGPVATLEPSYERSRFFRVSVSQAAFTTVVFMTLLMLLFWVFRRHEVAYFWYAAAAMVWALHDLNLFVLDPWLPMPIWRGMVASTLLWLSVFASLFVLRLSGRTIRGYERFILVLAVVVTLASPWLPVSMMHPTRVPVIETLCLLVPLYPTMLMLKAYFQRADLELLVMACAGMCLMTAATHDWMLVAKLVPRTNGFTIHLSTFFVFAGFGFVLLRRFSSALHDAEQLNATLERRVADKSAELEENYALLRDSERKNAAVAERQRLLSDMHDGVGGHLTAALAMADSESANQTSAAIGHAMADLRMILDATAPNVPFGTALAGLRQRIQPQLDAAGITLHWQVEGQGLEWRANQRLQMLRIVQEAMTNALKHSHCKHITIISRPHLEGWLVAVEDDGQGFDDAAIQRGKGLVNMQRRASSLGARFEVNKAPSGRGTRVTLVMRFAE